MLIHWTAVSSKPIFSVLTNAVSCNSLPEEDFIGKFCRKLMKISSLLGRCTVSTGQYLQTFRMYVLPLSSGSTRRNIQGRLNLRRNCCQNLKSNSKDSCLKCRSCKSISFIYDCFAQGDNFTFRFLYKKNIK